MPDLYVANTTKQHYTLCYRPKLANPIPTTNGHIQTHGGDVRRYDIPMGAQIRVGGKALAPEEIRVILDQLEPYGIVNLKTLHKVRGFVGLCYNEQDPIPLDEMLERIQKNDEARTEASKDRLEATTLAIKDKLQRAAVGDERAAVNSVSTEIVEESGPANNNQPRIAAGVEAVSDGVEPKGKRRAAF